MSTTEPLKTFKGVCEGSFLYIQWALTTGRLNQTYKVVKRTGKRGRSGFVELILEDFRGNRVVVSSRDLMYSWNNCSQRSGFENKVKDKDHDFLKMIEGILNNGKNVKPMLSVDVQVFLKYSGISYPCSKQQLVSGRRIMVLALHPDTSKESNSHGLFNQAMRGFNELQRMVG